MSVHADQVGFNNRTNLSSAFKYFQKYIKEVTIPYIILTLSSTLASLSLNILKCAQEHLYKFIIKLSILYFLFILRADQRSIEFQFV